VVSGNIHTHPKERFWKFHGRRGFTSKESMRKKKGISRRIAGGGGGI